MANFRLITRVNLGYLSESHFVELFNARGLDKNKRKRTGAAGTFSNDNKTKVSIISKRRSVASVFSIVSSVLFGVLLILSSFTASTSYLSLFPVASAQLEELQQQQQQLIDQQYQQQQLLMQQQYPSS